MLLDVSTAERIIQQHLPNWRVSDVDLAEAGNLSLAQTLAQTIVSDRAYPPYHRVMMDGIAVAWSAYNSGQRIFAIEGLAAAGMPPVTLSDPCACWEVMTGAVLPEGTDLVIPYEELKITGGQAIVVQDSPRRSLDYVHLKGSDCSAGQEIMPAGSVINSPRYGILAALGYSQVAICHPPKVELIATGDELVAIAASPEPYQIRSSNVYALRSALHKSGYAEVGIVHLPDDPAAIRQHYQQARTQNQLLIYSGGVSQGKRDYLPQIWQELGVTQLFHGIAQRPGKPMWFGVDQQYQTVIVGLPGNPVSSLVCLHRYFLKLPKIWGKLTEKVVFIPNLTYFLPVQCTYTAQGEITVQPVKWQNSGDFLALADSDGFIELPQERSEFRAGECFPFYGWQ
jgi:molybdopterin molybdotransferase